MPAASGKEMFVPENTTDKIVVTGDPSNKTHEATERGVVSRPVYQVYAYANNRTEVKRIHPS